MKRIALIIPLILLAACSSPEAEATVEETVVESPEMDTQLADKDAEIADLELQVQELTEELELVQSAYDTLVLSSQGEPAMEAEYLCESRPETMKYQNPASTIAIIEGWLALQPNVEEFQGAYTTIFWQDVKSRMHTVRYIDTESGLSKRVTFLIFFAEAGWKEGVLDMTNQCWLDYPE